MPSRTAKPAEAPEPAATEAAEKPPEAPPIGAKAVAPPESITLKLVAVLAEVGSVPKLGRNRSQNYSFVRESDLVERIRPLMAREHLFLHQTVLDYKVEAQGQTQRGGTNWLTTVKIRFTWVNGDTGDMWAEGITEWYGTGQDTGDKGFYKACTGAEKYFLFKTFLVSTGDDPEGDENVDKRAAEGEAVEGARVSGRTSTRGQGRGGKSSVPTPVQIRELWRLFTAAKMKAPDVLTFIERVLKIKTDAVDPTKQGELLNFVQSMRGEQVGILIRTLSEETGDQGDEVKDADTDAGGEAPDDGADEPADEEQSEELGDQPIG